MRRSSPPFSDDNAHLLLSTDLSRLSLYKVKLFSLDFTLPQIKQLTCFFTDCDASGDSPFPSISTFPSLEALNYFPCLDSHSYLDLHVCHHQLLALESNFDSREAGSCLVLHDDQCRPVAFPPYSSIMPQQSFLRLWSVGNDHRLITSDILTRAAKAIDEADASSFRLTRLYLPTAFSLHHRFSAYIQPGLTAFLAACKARGVVVVFEDRDDRPGGQRISQDFLEFAKSERRRKEAEECQKQE